MSIVMSGHETCKYGKKIERKNSWARECIFSSHRPQKSMKNKRINIKEEKFRILLEKWSRYRSEEISPAIISIIAIIILIGNIFQIPRFTRRRAHSNIHCQILSCFVSNQIRADFVSDQICTHFVSNGLYPQNRTCACFNIRRLLAKLSSTVNLSPWTVGSPRKFGESLTT